MTRSYGFAVTEKSPGLGPIPLRLPVGIQQWHDKAGKPITVTGSRGICTLLPSSVLGILIRRLSIVQ